MIYHIIYHEWLRHKRGKFQLLLIALVCGLLVCTALIHWQQTKSISEAQAHWQSTSDALWANQPDRHPHRVAHYGHVVVRPQAPLSFVEPGVNPHVGNYLFLEAHRQNSSSVQNSAINPVSLKLGFPSASTLMLVLWPLLIIVLGYGVFSDEWDTGRLYWLASMGASVWQLFLGKVVIYVLYTLLLLAAVGLASVALLSLNGEFSAELLGDLLALLLVLGLYSLFWISIVFSVSYISRDSNQSLWRLLTIWIVLVILVPKLSSGLAQTFYPLPDRANFNAAVEKAVHAVGDSHNPDDPYFASFKAATLARYNAERIEDLPLNWNGLLMAEGERITSEIFQTHYREVNAQILAQENFHNIFGFVSPIIAVQRFAQTITGTDRKTAEHFEQAAEAFRFALIQQLNNLHSHEIAHTDDREQKISATVWQEMGLFDYTQPKDRHISLIVFLSLGLWCAIALTLTGLFRQQEVCR